MRAAYAPASPAAGILIATRLPYSAPKLESLGSLVELTQDRPSGGRHVRRQRLHRRPAAGVLTAFRHRHLGLTIACNQPLPRLARTADDRSVDVTVEVTDDGRPLHADLPWAAVREGLPIWRADSAGGSYLRVRYEGADGSVAEFVVDGRRRASVGIHEPRRPVGGGRRATPRPGLLLRPVAPRPDLPACGGRGARRARRGARRCEGVGQVDDGAGARARRRGSGLGRRRGAGRGGWPRSRRGRRAAPARATRGGRGRGCLV